MFIKPSNTTNTTLGYNFILLGHFEYMPNNVLLIFVIMASFLPSMHKGNISILVHFLLR